MTNYQSLTKYSGDMYGVPKYQGIEYDYEVPDNLVVSSPGGVSSVHHHWTKGFGGRGNTSSDIYAGQGPQYISGAYGNMYKQGHTSSSEYYPAPPDTTFWKNQEPAGDITPPNQKEGFVLLDPEPKEESPTRVGIVEYGLLLLLVLSMAFWTNASYLFIKQTADMTWKTSGAAALFFSLLLASGLWIKYD